jgi:uncharacterized membrane protein YgcG
LFAAFSNLTNIVFPSHCHATLYCIALTKLCVLDTISTVYECQKHCPSKIEVVTASPILARAIDAIATNRSLSTAVELSNYSSSSSSGSSSSSSDGGGGGSGGGGNSSSNSSSSISTPHASNSKL